MPTTVLIAEDDAAHRDSIAEHLRGAGYRTLEASDAAAALDLLRREQVAVMLTGIDPTSVDGMDLMVTAHKVDPELLTIIMTGQGATSTVISALRNHACDLLARPISSDSLLSAVKAALARRRLCEIELVSGKPDWVEVRVPCDLKAVDPVKNFFMALDSNLPEQSHEALGEAFREMLTNAIEHGGKCDATQRVRIKWLRLKRAILYSIKDPGGGFDITDIEHAAVANPASDPYRHLRVREQKGLRPGGFGILLASQVIDELIYNERHNELIIVKYI